MNLILKQGHKWSRIYMRYKGIKAISMQSVAENNQAEQIISLGKHDIKLSNLQILQNCLIEQVFQSTQDAASRKKCLKSFLNPMVQKKHLSCAE